MTEDGREVLAQVVGGDSNITLQMEDVVTLVQRRICHEHVRPIRSDEIEDAFKEAGIEIPETVAAAEEGTSEDDDLLKMPEVPDWANVEPGTRVEFKDAEGEITPGLYSGTNDDGNLVVTVLTGDESFDIVVLPENARLAVDGPGLLQGIGKLADAVGQGSGESPPERPAPGPANLSPSA